jgi:hypothetical protein
MTRRPNMQPGIEDWLVVRNVAIALDLADEASAAQAHFEELSGQNDAKVSQVKRAEPVRRLAPGNTPRASH